MCYVTGSKLTFSFALAGGSSSSLLFDLLQKPQRIGLVGLLSEEPANGPFGLIKPLQRGVGQCQIPPCLLVRRL